MAKWRRGGGGRRRWVIEYVPTPAPEPEPEPITLEVTAIPDPFEHDDPYAIRQALAAMENDAPAESTETVN